MQTPIIKINDFQGPLDLLLNLVKDKEINILDLNLNVVTNQYIQYLQIISCDNLEIASEYLLMGTFLLELQSKELLPQSKEESHNNFTIENERKRLIQQLLEYKKFKDISNYFKEQ